MSLHHICQTCYEMLHTRDQSEWRIQTLWQAEWMGPFSVVCACQFHVRFLRFTKISGIGCFMPQTWRRHPVWAYISTWVVGDHILPIFSCPLGSVRGPWGSMGVRGGLSMSPEGINWSKSLPSPDVSYHWVHNLSDPLLTQVPDEKPAPDWILSRKTATEQEGKKVLGAKGTTAFLQRNRW